MVDEVPMETRLATMADVVAIVNRSPQSMVVVRFPEAIITAANAAAGELFGESTAELVGRHATSLFHGADEVRSNIAMSALASGALDSYCSRRRLATRHDAEAWTCVRAFEVEDEIIAIAMAVPVDHPRPLD
ncbi:MAG: PAS domain S-box protein, partial [Actinomycetota bacterium]|nr:PAS domain S-box protein [Actinomycetota bacterium]